MPNLKRILTAPWRALVWFNYGDTSQYTSDEAADPFRVPTSSSTLPQMPQRSTKQIADAAVSRGPSGGPNLPGRPMGGWR